MKHYFDARLTRIFNLLLLLAFNAGVSAHNNVVVIPLLDQEIKNVITVAKVGGDFRSPLEAMESISDATEKNPYLIAIAPGEYVLNETLKLKKNVSVVGSGREITRLISGGENLQSLLTIENVIRNSIVSDLSIINNSRGINCTAIRHYESDVLLKNLTATVKNCDLSVAIDIISGARLNNVIATARGNTPIGISTSFNPAVHLEDVFINVVGGRSSVTTVALKASSGGFFEISNSKIQVGSPGNAMGISVSNSTVPSSLVNTSITSRKNGSAAQVTAINLTNGSEMTVKGSKIKSEGVSLFADATSSIIVSTSTVAGDVGGTDNSGEKKCITSDNGMGDALSSSCE